jgi:hypothetical protein
LSAKLGVDGVFTKGRSLGSSISHVLPQTISLVSGAFQLALNEGTLAKLESLEVEIGPFEAATMVGSNPLTYSFPLRTGALAPDLSNGFVTSETGLRLHQDEHKGLLSVLAMGASLESNYFSAGVDGNTSAGKRLLFGTMPIGTLDRTGASGQFDPQSRSVTYSGVGVVMTQAFADALNDTFAEPKGKGTVFKGGEPLGVFGLSAQAQ